MEEELVTLVWHIGWLHFKFDRVPKERAYGVIKELDSDSAALMRKMLVNDMVREMEEDGKLTQEQIEETYNALHSHQWWWTIGELNMDILHGVDTTKNPYERWLDSKSYYSLMIRWKQYYT